MPFTESPESELYLRVRQKEGRVYPDDIVARLPSVRAGDPLANEWRARGASLHRLMDYLERLSRPVTVLELGCGNGWLSHHLSTLAGARVWGIDRNHRELAQAARLFGHHNLAFLNTDIFIPPFRSRLFDVIVLASVIQYFPDLHALIRGLGSLLGPRGQLHILDSPLYEEEVLEAAQRRTQAYYAALGFPEMSNLYFHHTYSEVRQYSPRWLYRPGSLQSRLSRLFGRVTSPFPWLSICLN